MIGDSKGYLRDREAAEAVALRALAYLAGDEEALVRFLRLTGLNPTTLRKAAGDPAFLVAVVDHFLGNESLLLAFSAASGLSPQALPQVRRLLDQS